MLLNDGIVYSDKFKYINLQIICKDKAKQISVAFKTPLKNKMRNLYFKTSFLKRPDLLLSFERVLLLSTASPPRYRGRC